MLSSRAFGLDYFAREGKALAALNRATEALVSAFWMRRACSHGIAQFAFPDSIADTNNHERTPNANRYHR
jgi:hypothetical protein